MGRKSTGVAVRKHLASLQRKTKGKDPISDSTVKGYRSTLGRLERFSPYLPATKEAVEKAIGYPGEASINKRISRYDCINRFSKELADSGIPNPCDEIRRPRKSDEISTQELVDRYLEKREISVNSDATFNNDLRVLKRLVFICPTLPASLAQIGKVIGRRKDSDPENGYEQATRRLHYTVLYGFFEWEEVVNLEIPNLLRKIEKPKVGKTEKRIFTVEEVFKLVEAAADPLDRALILFLFDTGARIGEVFGIKVSNINAGRIQLTGKTGNHSVSISPAMEQMLRDIANENGDIWWDEQGPLRLGQLRYRFTRAVKAAGLTGKKLGPHTARHTFGTEWARMQGGTFQLQKQLGHSNISTTEEYGHLVGEDVSAAHKTAAVTNKLGLFGVCESTGSTDDAETVVPDVPGLEGEPLVMTRAEIAAMVAAEVRRARAAEEQRQRDAKERISLERLAQEECMELEGGRPPITIPAAAARMMLVDRKDGHTTSAIWRRYSPYYHFSRAWLVKAFKDGRIERMAESD